MPPRTTTSKTTSAQIRAASAAPRKQPARSRVTSLGDPGPGTPAPLPDGELPPAFDAAAAQQMLAQMQQQVAELQRAQAGEALRRRQAQELGIGSDPAAVMAPGRPGDPDILGVGGLKPLRISTAGRDLKTTRHAMFYIDDIAYTVPDEIGMDVATECMHLMASPVGEVAAQDYMLSALLGDEQYAEFRSRSAKLTPQEFMWIVTTCTRLVFGRVEAPKA